MSTPHPLPLLNLDPPRNQVWASSSNPWFQALLTSMLLKIADSSSVMTADTGDRLPARQRYTHHWPWSHWSFSSHTTHSAGLLPKVWKKQALTFKVTCVCKIFSPQLGVTMAIFYFSILSSHFPSCCTSPASNRLSHAHVMQFWPMDRKKGPRGIF